MKIKPFSLPRTLEVVCLIMCGFYGDGTVKMDDKDKNRKLTKEDQYRIAVSAIASALPKQRTQKIYTIMFALSSTIANVKANGICYTQYFDTIHPSIYLV